TVCSQRGERVGGGGEDLRESREAAADQFLARTVSDAAGCGDQQAEGGAAQYRVACRGGFDRLPYASAASVSSSDRRSRMSWSKSISASDPAVSQVLR